MKLYIYIHIYNYTIVAEVFSFVNEAQNELFFHI